MGPGEMLVDDPPCPPLSGEDVRAAAADRLAAPQRHLPVEGRDRHRAADIDLRLLDRVFHLR